MEDEEEESSRTIVKKKMRTGERRGKTREKEASQVEDEESNGSIV
jgi:hypothetical protein